jgi:hypothetical protein
MTYPDGLPPRALIFLLLVFVAGQIVAWRVFRLRKPGFASALKWSFITGLCAIFTMLALVVTVTCLGLWVGHPLDLGD